MLSGFRLDLTVKIFPLYINNISPCSSRGRPIVSAYSCHMFSTRDTECPFYSGLGATEDFLDYNLLAVSLPVRLAFTGLGLAFLINDLARSRV